MFIDINKLQGLDMCYVILKQEASRPDSSAI